MKKRNGVMVQSFEQIENATLYVVAWLAVSFDLQQALSTLPFF